VIATVERQLGPIALLVNNAGIAGEGGLTWVQRAERWWEVFEVNVLGALLCSRAALPGMRARGRGRIVNVASNAAFMSLAEGPVDRIGSAYMASKAAVVRFSEALDSEARAEGVRVFAISPGTVKSEMTASIFLEEWDDPAFWNAGRAIGRADRVHRHGCARRTRGPVRPRRGTTTGGRSPRRRRRSSRPTATRSACGRPGTPRWDQRSMPSMMSEAFTTAVTSEPAWIPSSRTASTVTEATSRTPPASRTTLAIASPCVMLVTRAGIWLRALSFMRAA
jgi:NAD(P)-dependent dehydrogenase (short-subunit alcohol dehydrogenase family)